MTTQTWIGWMRPRIRSMPPLGTGIGRSTSGTGLGHRSSICSATIANSSDRKSTRLNSSHGSNSYAVFCLKKKTLTKLDPKTGEVLEMVGGDNYDRPGG